MDYSRALCACVLLLFCLKPTSATSASELLAPLLAPIMDEVCNSVECGKGRCRETSQSALLFECECEDGWKQTVGNDPDELFRFLPCVIPDCTLDYSCSQAPPPMPYYGTIPDPSTFDPCDWSQCGTGSCSKTSSFSYDCLCPRGSTNILNISSLPCLRSCEIGADCRSLGIVNDNTDSSSANPGWTGNKGSRTRGNARLLTFLAIFLAVIFAETELIM